MRCSAMSHCFAVFALGVGASVASAGVLFTDDFEGGASPLWGNEIGMWVAENGVYSATAPSNFPPTVSSLPFVLRDFTIEMDINDIQDGGVWLRTELNPTTGGALHGVLLVTGGELGTYSGFYWHTFENGQYSPALEPSGTGLFEPGVSDVTIRVEVTGDSYSVYLDNDPTPATALTTSLFCEGRVGLYDYSNQTFDNIVLTELTGACPADIDCNGTVDVADLLLLLAAWGGTSGRADINDDGLVEVQDLLLLLAAWGPCP